MTIQRWKRFMCVFQTFFQYVYANLIIGSSSYVYTIDLEKKLTGGGGKMDPQAPHPHPLQLRLGIERVIVAV